MVEQPDAGSLRWIGEPRVQLVHQNPLGAFDPRWTIGRSLREGLEAAGVPRGRRAERVAELLDEVGLAPELADRRPRALSGGQRQRAAIARALAADPEVLVLDEPVSALDPSVRERVLQLLGRLQHERKLTMILVSHDLDVVGAVADEGARHAGWPDRGAGRDRRGIRAPQHPFHAGAAGGERSRQSLIWMPRPAAITGASCCTWNDETCRPAEAVGVEIGHRIETAQIDCLWRA